MCAPALHPRPRGFTLVEAMIVLAILTILVVIAVPSMVQMIDRQRINSAAEAILSDLRWARGEAIKRNREVRVSFSSATPWSYNIAVAPFGSGDVIKTVSGADFSHVSMGSANFSNQVFTTFDPVRGTASAGSVALSSNHFSARVLVSALGRVRICGLAGYEACP